MNVIGINNHESTSTSLVTEGGATYATFAEVIVMLYQYECYPKTMTVHSSDQIECCENGVDDHVIKVGGTQ